MIGIGMPTSHMRIPRIRRVLRLVPGRQRDRHASGSIAGVLRAFVIAIALAGCEIDPGAAYLGGIGDPVRGAAIQAPALFGDFPRYAGNPAAAAQGAAQLEFLTEALRTDPRFGPRVDPGVLLALRRARSEMRAAIGIAPDAPSDEVVRRLRAAAAALEAGSPVRAEAALASAEFTRDPRAVLAALADAPPLPEAARAANIVANEINRLDRRL